MHFYFPIANLSLFYPLLLTAGFFAGLFSGALGIGGGFLLTPLLILFGVPSAIAVGTVSCQTAATALSALLPHIRKKQINLSLGLRLLGGSLPAAAAGVFLFRLAAQAGLADFIIAFLYFIVLSLIGISLIIASFKQKERLGVFYKENQSYKGFIFNIRRFFIHKKMESFLRKFFFSSQSHAFTLIIGFAVGMLSAFMGIGGGLIFVPLMLYLFRQDVKTAVATSLFQIAPNGALVTVLHAWQNHSVDMLLALFLVFGGACGAKVGIKTAENLGGNLLKLLFGITTVSIGFAMFFSLVLTPHSLYEIRFLSP